MAEYARILSTGVDDDWVVKRKQASAEITEWYRGLTTLNALTVASAISSAILGTYSLPDQIAAKGEATMTEDEKTSQTPAGELVQQITLLSKKRQAAAARIKALQKEIETIDLQIKTYEHAGGLVFGERRFQSILSAAQGGTDFFMMQVVDGNVEAVRVDVHEGTGKSRSMSEIWAKLLSSVSQQGDFGYDDLETMAGILGHEVGKAGLRSQVKLYVDDGLLERVSNGTFRVLPKAGSVIEEALGKATQRPAMTEALSEPRDPWCDLEDLIGYTGTSTDRPDVFS
jgi:hypothetical protein